MGSSMVVEAAGAALAARDREPMVTKRRLTLRQARLRAALSLNELAKEAGVSSGTVSAIEHGEAVPRMPTIRKLATALGLAPSDIAWPHDPLELEQWDTDAPDAPQA